jgi:hypothetical protein
MPREVKTLVKIANIANKLTTETSPINSLGGNNRTRLSTIKINPGIRRILLLCISKKNKVLLYLKIRSKYLFATYLSPPIDLIERIPLNDSINTVLASLFKLIDFAFHGNIFLVAKIIKKLQIIKNKIVRKKACRDNEKSTASPTRAPTPPPIAFIVLKNICPVREASSPPKDE